MKSRNVSAPKGAFGAYRPAKPLRQNSGQSLIGVLTGLAVSGVVLLTTMSMLDQGQRGQSRIKYALDADSFNEEVRALLSSPEACRNSFAGRVAEAGREYEINTLFDGTASPGVAVYSTGSIYGDHSLKLSSMKLADFMPGSFANKAQMTLIVDVGSQKETFGGRARPRTVRLSLDLDGDQRITSCIALAKMSDGIWQRSPANLNNISFNAGNVGVGALSPTVKLDVAGEVKAGNTGLVCGASIAGAIRYNAGKMEYCNGTNSAWTEMGGGSDSGTICGMRLIACTSKGGIEYDSIVSSGGNSVGTNRGCKGSTLTATCNIYYSPAAVMGCPVGYVGGWIYHSMGSTPPLSEYVPGDPLHFYGIYCTKI